ncbi:hypothetical protein D6853_15020 [Butyrivibrio sp. X503]|uniref:hypothetical protein n=1 Tax=Butyrivibrio sp. X503 TaxID=2364878 RepID=UPI000EAA5C19|nr:hypothetical protein [Butyrivibrio sp. X503]RKM53847.1 hypothetical protein D6853_15020 [Butyrivibrio sp. X503]
MSNVMGTDGVSSAVTGAVAGAVAGVVGINDSVLASVADNMKLKHNGLLELIEEAKAKRAQAQASVTGPELEQIDLLIRDMEEKAGLVADNIAMTHNHILSTRGGFAQLGKTNCNIIRECYEGATTGGTLA